MPRLSVVPEALNEIKQHFITHIPISPLLEVEAMLLKKIDERHNVAIHPIHLHILFIILFILIHI
jgi:hypothetical protein